MQQVNQLLEVIRNALVISHEKPVEVHVLVSTQEEAKNHLLKYWKPDANYALHYTYDGEEHFGFFKNSSELAFWQHLQNTYLKNKNKPTEIINLYMWDNITGPTIIEDTGVHFKRAYLRPVLSLVN